MIQITADLIATAARQTGDPLALLKQLQQGQLLKAVVTTTLAENLVRLQIGTLELLAKTPLQLTAGAKLDLQVTSPLPNVELRILNNLENSTVQQRLLRNALPKSLAFDELFRGMSQLLGDKSSQRVLPGGVQKSLEALFQNLLGAQRVDGSRLEQAIKDVGLLTEHRLLNSQLQPQDLKGALLRTLSLLQGSGEAPPQTALPSTPPKLTPAMQQLLASYLQVQGEAEAARHAERQAGAPRPADSSNPIAQLIRLLEGGIARIQSHQAASLPTGEDPGRLLWQFELPIRLHQQVDAFLVQVEEEDGNRDRPTDHRWRVVLQFNFKETGPVQTRLVIEGEQVAATFWSDEAATDEKIRRRLPQLSEMLERAGLSVGRLSAVHGPPPERLVVRKQNDLGLVDEQA